MASRLLPRGGGAGGVHGSLFFGRGASAGVVADAKGSESGVTDPAAGVTAPAAGGGVGEGDSGAGGGRSLGGVANGSVSSERGAGLVNWDWMG